MNRIEEESFGIIPLIKEGTGWRVLLILHKMGNHWGFPKGHGHEGELPQESAQRELKEETGLEVDRFLQEEPFVERYQFKKKNDIVYKKVLFFPAIVKGDIHLQIDEVRDAKWVDLKQAQELLSFKEARNICKQVVSLVLNRT